MLNKTPCIDVRIHSCCSHSLKYFARGPELLFALKQMVELLKLVSKTYEIGSKSRRRRTKRDF